MLVYVLKERMLQIIADSKLVVSSTTYVRSQNWWGKLQTWSIRFGPGQRSGPFPIAKHNSCHSSCDSSENQYYHFRKIRSLLSFCRERSSTYSFSWWKDLQCTRVHILYGRLRHASDCNSFLCRIPYKIIEQSCHNNVIL